MKKIFRIKHSSLTSSVGWRLGSTLTASQGGSKRTLDNGLCRPSHDDSSNLTDLESSKELPRLLTPLLCPRRGEALDPIALSNDFVALKACMLPFARQMRTRGQAALPHRSARDTTCENGFDTGLARVIEVRRQ